MISYIFASIFATPFSSDIGTRFAIYFCNLFQDIQYIKLCKKFLLNGHIRELKHQMFLTTRTAGRSRRTGSKPAFLVRNRKLSSLFL